MKSLLVDETILGLGLGLAHGVGLGLGRSHVLFLGLALGLVLGLGVGFGLGLGLGLHLDRRLSRGDGPLFLFESVHLLLHGVQFLLHFLHRLVSHDQTCLHEN
jgi:hypothetical protein